ncbi:MAG TPA: hypothetical protein EYP19_14785, partial [Desulfobacterales bacterium]|nr:hypothetical protein [Desulfobacterales bacterium]
MKLIWLSHVLEQSTPLYGGAKDLDIRIHRSLLAGNSCNATVLTITSHTGTHVDVPYHFLTQGQRIDAYPPEAWVFDSPWLLDVPIEPGELITRGHLPANLSTGKDVDLILIRTGFERFRENDVYWRQGPGLTLEMADHLINLYPCLRAIGVDCISISSLLHRKTGHEVHRLLLGQGMLIFEDLTLREIGEPYRLKKVWA